MGTGSNPGLGLAAVCVSIVILPAAAQEDPYCFGDRRDFVTQQEGWYGLTNADLDGDGIEDLVFRNGVHYGIGAGLFLPPESFDAGVTPGSLGRAEFGLIDFDLDGDQDIVVAGETPTGGVIAAAKIVNGPVFYSLAPFPIGFGHEVTSICAANMDGAGLPEVVLASWSTGVSGLITVLRIDSAGEFATLAQYVTDEAPNLPASSVQVFLTAADLDIDGDTDIVASIKTSGLTTDGFVVYLNDGLGALTPQPFHPVPLLCLETSALVADFTGDGLPDLIQAGEICPGNEDSLVLFRGFGDGTIGPPETIAVAQKQSEGSIRRIVAADLNLDGLEDVVAGLHLDDALLAVLHINQGAGSFSRVGPLSMGFQGPSRPGIAIGDFVEDGYPEIATRAGALSVLTNRFGSCDADLNRDCSLDFTDVTAFLSAFGAGEPLADLAEPMGQLDFSDVVVFLGAFGGGCP